ncbi:MAG: hypothetical protein IT329_21360 [Caldilineaceae bacterium]|nr:hypothetical protein [Caldilineaceae bacterium]
MSTESIPPQPGTPASRPDQGIQLIAGYHFVVAVFFVLGTVILAFPTVLLGILGFTDDPGAFIGMFAVGLIAMVSMIFCILYIAIGYGLWTLRQWGRIAAMALGVVSLFMAPIGTIAGGLTLWYLLKPEVAARFE